MLRYYLSDFEKILKEGIDYEIPQETIEMINSLASQVGAPEYIKTPQFKSKLNYLETNVRRKKKFIAIEDNDWETIRNFQSTEFKKKEGIEIILVNIRTFLNMITDSNYEKIQENIINEINNIEENNEEFKVFIFEEVFKIVSSNILFSETYAKLYKILIDNYIEFERILYINFNNYEQEILKIEYFDPEIQYDLFCDNNVKNEKRRALSLFYVNLMKEKILNENQIGEIILKIFIIIDNFIKEENKKNELDELAEILYILVINSYKNINLINKEISLKIYENIERVINLKIKETPGITNKFIFKHMDILDEIC